MHDRLTIIKDSALFSAEWYAAEYADVTLSGIPPLDHYVRLGAGLRRSPHPLFSTEYYLSQLPAELPTDVDPLIHYLEYGWKHGVNPHPLFDVGWYLLQNPDVAAAGREPLQHYLLDGCREGRQPHPQFPVSDVFTRFPSLAGRHENPLLYYVTGEWLNDPCPVATAFLIGHSATPQRLLRKVAQAACAQIARVTPHRGDADSSAAGPPEMTSRAREWLSVRQDERGERPDAVEIYGHSITPLAIPSIPLRPIQHESVFVDVVVYADSPGPHLRMTLEAIVASRGSFDYEMTVICDWDHSSDYPTEVARGCRVRVLHTTAKRGFYESVASVLRGRDGGAALVIRAGVVVAKDTIAELLTQAVVNDSCDVLAPVTNNTPGLDITIRQGENIHTTSRHVSLLSGDRPVVICGVPSLDIFLVTRRALRLVPFPHWKMTQDASHRSLVRFFATLGQRGSRVGLLMTAYAHCLNARQVPDEAINAAVEPAHAARFAEVNDSCKSALARVQEMYKGCCPVIAAQPTVVFVMQGLTLGGGGIVVVSLANDLILRGCNVKFYCRTISPRYKLDFDLLFEPKMYSAQDLQAVRQDLPGDAVIVATLWTTARDVEALVAGRSGRTGIYFIQDYEPFFYKADSDNEEERSYHTGAHDSYHAALTHVYTSDWIAGQLSNAGVLDPGSARKANVGIDHSIFPPHQVNRPRGGARPIVIGAMARPSTPRRGFPLLVKALGQIKRQNPDAHIILFGANDYSQYGLPFEHECAGVVSPHDMSALYDRMDIFIDASDFQGFGLCALEAMASGCACVLTDSGGVSEYAQHRINSFIVPHDADALAAAVLELAADEDQRRSLSRAAAMTAVRFDKRNLADKFLKMVESVDRTARQTGSASAVIVPVYNGVEVARQCIESVLPTLASDDVLVLVDDCSDEYTATVLAGYGRNDPRVIVLRNERNLGFVGSVNRGMEYADRVSKHTVLLNSDTIVPPGWLDRLRRVALESAEAPAVVSPLATESSHLRLELNAGDNFLSANRWLASRQLPPAPEVITPEGWCLFLPLAVQRAIGQLDVVYGRGYCEESDLCMRAYAAGYRLKICEDVLIHHYGKVTFGAERGPLYENNRRIFDRRWKAIYEAAYERFRHRHPLEPLRRQYSRSARYRLRERPRENALSLLTRILEHPATSGHIDRLRHRHASRSVSRRAAAESVAFLLPEIGPFGGVLSVASLVNSLIRAGCDAKIVVLKDDRKSLQLPGCLTSPILLDDYRSLVDDFPDVDMLVATGWISVYYAAHIAASRPEMAVGYYVQDYEPDFPDVIASPQLHAAARQTYQLGLPSFCKTRWIASKIAAAEHAYVHLVPPSLDVDRFYPRPMGGQEGGCDVLAMYRPYTAQRGHETIEAVVRRVKSALPQAKVWVFGDASIPERLLAEGLIDRNLGIIPNQDLPKVYSSAKVFLEASSFHGFGRTIAEAMACGTACVITRSGGPEEFCVDGVNAVLRDVGDAEGLAEATIRLLRDENERLRIVRSARKAVEAFHPTRSARAIAEFLDLSCVGGLVQPFV